MKTKNIISIYLFYLNIPIIYRFLFYSKLNIIYDENGLLNYYFTILSEILYESQRSFYYDYIWHSNSFLVSTYFTKYLILKVIFKISDRIDII